MLLEPNTRRAQSAHVIVVGNEKGGSGKSTTAMHIAIALLNLGQRVATIDLDSRQKSFTRYIDNRRAWAQQARLDLRVPMHFCVARGSTLKLDENEAIEFAGFAEAVAAVERSHDFVVVDTPGTDSYLTRLVHFIGDLFINTAHVSFVCIGRAHQAPGRAVTGRALGTARVPLCRRAGRTGDLPRVLSPRTDGARQPRRGDAGYETQPVPCHRPRRSHEIDREI